MTTAIELHLHATLHADYSTGMADRGYEIPL